MQPQAIGWRNHATGIVGFGLAGGAGGAGGAISHEALGHSLTLCGDVFTGNVANDSGGALFRIRGRLTNLTVAGNEGDGLYGAGPNIVLRNSIIANNVAGSGDPENPSCDSSFVDGGANLQFPMFGVRRPAASNRSAPAPSQPGPFGS